MFPNGAPPPDAIRNPPYGSIEDRSFIAIA